MSVPHTLVLRIDGARSQLLQGVDPLRSSHRWQGLTQKHEHTQMLTLVLRVNRASSQLLQGVGAGAVAANLSGRRLQVLENEGQPDSIEALCVLCVSCVYCVCVICMYGNERLAPSGP